MEQKSPNAILNEMSHPKKCHMNQCPSLLQTQSEEILSQWRKDLCMQPDELQQHEVCHQNIS